MTGTFGCCSSRCLPETRLGGAADRFRVRLKSSAAPYMINRQFGPGDQDWQTLLRHHALEKVLLPIEYECPISEIRESSRQSLARASETEGHPQVYDSGAAFDLKFLTRACGERCRNFK